MAADKILISYSLDGEKKEIHRLETQGDKILRDKVVAKYDPETQVLVFENLRGVRDHKVGVVAFLAENEYIVKRLQRADLKADEPLSSKNIPPRPKKNPLEGDKTPEVVQWYHDHHFNEFCTRYGVLGRYTGQVSYLEPVWEPHKDRPEVPEYRGQRRVEKMVTNAIVALRKTNLTFTPEECVDFDEEVPDNTEQVAAAPTNVRAWKDVDET